jgi:hypothetical protein
MAGKINQRLSDICLPAPASFGVKKAAFYPCLPCLCGRFVAHKKNPEI